MLVQFWNLMTELRNSQYLIATNLNLIQVKNRNKRISEIMMLVQ